MRSSIASTRRRRVLRTMGIEVFVRRGGDTVATLDAAPRETERKAPPPSPPVGGRTDAVEAVAEADREWDLVALSGAAGVVAGRFESPEERRLAQGVYLALAGPGAEPATARFQWPPEGLIDRHAHSATAALAAFLSGQVERAGAACLVLLGESLPEPRIAVAVPVVCGPSARALIGDANGKRSLWKQIEAMRKR